MTTATANGTAKAAKATADTRNVYERVAAALAEIPSIPKTATIERGRGSYKGVTHDLVKSIVRPAMLRHGVLMLCSVVEAAHDDIMMSTKNGDRWMNRAKVRCEVTFVNTANPTDRFSVSGIGQGIDDADKADGKATSYAWKDTVLAALALETGQNDEAVAGSIRTPAGVVRGLKRRRQDGPQMDLHAVVTSYSNHEWSKSNAEAWEAFKHAHDMPPSGKPDDDTAARIAAYLAHRHAQGHTWADVLASPDKGFGSN